VIPNGIASFIIVSLETMFQFKETMYILLNISWQYLQLFYRNVTCNYELNKVARVCCVTMYLIMVIKCNCDFKSHSCNVISHTFLSLYLTMWYCNCHLISFLAMWLCLILLLLNFISQLLFLFLLWGFIEMWSLSRKKASDLLG